MNAPKRRLWIDTDTASDDAVALIMALASSAVEVAGISVTAGNVGLDTAVSNAVFTAELCGSDVPVFAGAGAPLKRPLEIADWFHGQDGLGDCGYRPQNFAAKATDAVTAMLQFEGPAELITLGPLTNVAAAVTADPGFARRISRCVVMGGAPCCEGNVTPAAEFNIWVDPEAAEIVFRSSIPIEMVGWHLSRADAVVSEAEMEQMRCLNSHFAEFALQSNRTAIDSYRRQTGERGLSLPDPIAMAVLLDPDIVTLASSHFVAIETTSELTRGMTVVDRLNVAADARNQGVWKSALDAGHQTRVVWEVNVSAWKKMLFAALQ